MTSREQDTKMASDQPQTGSVSTWNQTNVAHGGSNTSDPRQFQMPVLTEEEKLVMKECDRDSFFLRALPASIGSMIAAHVMVKNGRWKAHPKMGSLPKVLIFGGIGYFVGKISYIPECQRKILDKLPNSNLSAAIRKSKGLSELENISSPLNYGTESAPSNKIREDYSTPEGLDDRFRPTLDRDVKELEPPTQEKSFTSYEDLRRRNRQEYSNQISRPHPSTPGAPSYKESPLMPQKPWPDAKPGDTDISLGKSSLPPSTPEAPPTRKRTNIWGDVID